MTQVPLQLLNPTTLRRSSCQRLSCRKKFPFFLKYPVRFTWSNVSPWSLWHERPTFATNILQLEHRLTCLKTSSQVNSVTNLWNTIGVAAAIYRCILEANKNRCHTAVSETDTVYGLRRQRWRIVDIDSRIFFWMLQRLDRDIISIFKKGYCIFKGDDIEMLTGFLVIWWVQHGRTISWDLRNQ